MVTGKETEEACSRPASARLCGRRERSKCPWELGERRTSGTGGMVGSGGCSSSLCCALSSESTEEPLASLKCETGSDEISALRSTDCRVKKDLCPYSTNICQVIVS